MACTLEGKSLAELNAYCHSLPLSPLPDTYVDPWSGCVVSFTIGRIGEGPREGEPTVAWNVNNCVKGGWDPSYRALVKALCLHQQKQAAAIPDPSYAFDPIPDVTDIPPPTTTEVQKYAGPLMTVEKEDPVSSIIAGPRTIVPATSAVPVTRPTTPSIIPAQRSTPTLQTSEGILDAVIGGVGGFITGGPIGAITGAIAGGFGGGTRGGETTGSPGTQPTGYGPQSFATGCPTGYTWSNGQCVKTGVSGWVQRTIPGGQTGTLPSSGYGAAVMGGFGIPAMEPAVVGQTQYGPILRCPTGAVLGKDNLCYQKGTITNKQRKWPKGPRPLLTGGEMKTLRKVKSLENKVKRAWQTAGKPGQTRCRRK